MLNQNIMECPSLVSELTLQNPLRWAINKLHYLFPPHEVEKIVELHLTSNGDGNEDKLLWLHHPNGVFSAKSFIKSLHDRTPSSLNNGIVDDFPWKKFWQVKVIPPNV